MNFLFTFTLNEKFICLTAVQRTANSKIYWFVLLKKLHLNLILQICNQIEPYSILLFRNIDKIFSSMALKPITIRWIRTGC